MVSGLEIKAEGGIVRITLNRPEKRNALSHQLLLELGAALKQVGDDNETRVVVIAAKGSVFCSGHDLSEMVGRTEAEYAALFSECTRVMQQLRRLPQPVIARVQGPAVAAGCQLVAACDLAVAAESATFATPGVQIGLFCTTPMVPLVRAIPAKPALEMLLTGAPIPAQRAYELGLVNRVVPADRLDATVQELADAIVASSPLILRLGKTAFYDQLNLSEPEAYSRATDLMTFNAQRHDAQEGITAFLTKRKPVWKGE
jgi:enoyl-CoA hydratase/carnithine racemase